MRGLDPLVGDDHHVHPARVLEAVGGEAHRAPPPVSEPHRDLAEVELRELAGHPFEAHQEGCRDRRAHLAQDLIERAEAERGAVRLQSAQDLAWGRVRIIDRERPHPLHDGGVHRRPADVPVAPGRPVIGAVGCCLLPNPLHRAGRDPEVLGDLGWLRAGSQHFADGMSIEHSEHPPFAPPAGEEWNSGTRKPRSGCPREGDRI
jgi:hypothetical protein